MTEQEKIRKLAEWLGWELHQDRATAEFYYADREGNLKEWRLVWNPFTSLDHAWMLVEKGVERFDFRLFYDCTIRMWRVYFLSQLPPIITEADTAQHAICEAILRLMEGDGESHSNDPWTCKACGKSHFYNTWKNCQYCGALREAPDENDKPRGK